MWQCASRFEYPISVRPYFQWVRPNYHIVTYPHMIIHITTYISTYDNRSLYQCWYPIIYLYIPYIHMLYQHFMGIQPTSPRGDPRNNRKPTAGGWAVRRVWKRSEDRASNWGKLQWINCIGIYIYIYIYIWGFHKWGYPKNRWFVTENPIKMDD